MKSKYRGIIGFFLLLTTSFQTYWLSNEEKITSVERNKNILAIIITLCCFLGIVMTAFGISNLHGTRFEYDFTPVTRQARQNYLLLTIVGFLYIIASIFGYFGVCERKNIFAKAYMMLCIAFGLGLMLMYFIWLLLDHVLIPDFEVTEHGIQKLIVSPYDVTVARNYMLFMLFSAVLQISLNIKIWSTLG
ncbi:uncharacterized protein [Halyomorpha halys]|uniref:uncharacterized protein isoform X2 n=1 Tax=Halyomorpha halys TaxID=286706 RepID=UPI0006D4C961|nr:uncharacterized protein LOC106678207 [Halyomorpha halys]